MRRNMPVTERQKLRDKILEEELSRARKRASERYRTITCVKGMHAWGATAAELHGACQGEQAPGGTGCLCECHDDHRGGVASGTASEIGSDPSLTS